jgi:hypothetical protein
MVLPFVLLVLLERALNDLGALGGLIMFRLMVQEILNIE